MTIEPNSNQTDLSDGPSDKFKSRRLQPPDRDLFPLPGLAAISLYLFVLAGVIILGVVRGPHYPPLFLVFAAGFITASGGLLMLFRWAWALALAAVFLLVV